MILSGLLGDGHLNLQLKEKNVEQLTVRDFSFVHKQKERERGKQTGILMGTKGIVAEIGI